MAEGRNVPLTADALLWLLPPAVLLTATLSGVFGMGGGMVLIGLLAQVLSVPEAMVLHGTIQLASNGSRCILLLPHVRWRICGFYLTGALIGVVVCVALDLVVSRTVLFLLLGGVPLIAALIRTPPGFSATRPLAAVACGVVVTGAQVVAGVSGPLLDVFFVKSDLDRRQIVGTKAITQCVGHTLKLVYFVPHLARLETPSRIDGRTLLVGIACAFVGTCVGRRLLERLSEGRFRHWSTALASLLAILFLLRGVGGLLA